MVPSQDCNSRPVNGNSGELPIAPPHHLLYRLNYLPKCGHEEAFSSQLNFAAACYKYFYCNATILVELKRCITDNNAQNNNTQHQQILEQSSITGRPIATVSRENIGNTKL